MNSYDRIKSSVTSSLKIMQADVEKYKQLQDLYSNSISEEEMQAVKKSSKPKIEFDKLFKLLEGNDV
jgi:hypothetical protein